MTVEFIPYRPEHLSQLELQPAQAAWRDKMLRPGYAASLAIAGLAWSGRCQMSGKLIGCAGLLPQWPGRAVAWALLGDVSRRRWPAIIDRMAAELRHAHRAGYLRIEMQVRRDFAPGCRLARILGFEVEALMAAWGPEGDDYFLYARVG